MDEIFEKTLLYDFYGELLTEKQKDIYEQYHLEDLSLGEISEQMGISRQGVHDTIKKCEKQLHKYEEKLKLVDKFVSNHERVKRIYEAAQKIKSGDLINQDKLSQDKLSNEASELIILIENEAKAVLDDL